LSGKFSVPRIVDSLLPSAEIVPADVLVPEIDPPRMLLNVAEVKLKEMFEVVVAASAVVPAPRRAATRANRSASAANERLVDRDFTSLSSIRS
jgi:hypothetical protein